MAESGDGLVLIHDPSHNGIPVASLSNSDLPERVVTASELMAGFSKISAIKPIIIDLKSLHSEQGARDAKRLATHLRDSQDVDIWFIASLESAKRMPEICNIIGTEFDLLLYNRGGMFCN